MKTINGRRVQTEGIRITSKNRVKKFAGSGKSLIHDNAREETDAKRRALVEKMRNKDA